MTDTHAEPALADIRLLFDQMQRAERAAWRRTIVCHASDETAIFEALDALDDVGHIRVRCAAWSTTLSISVP